jgi:lipopolysaccharide/colanic/teichoic acid biosynthesis glycosyltransferase
VNSARSIWQTLLERFAAFVFLLLFAPTLGAAALLIWSTAGHPIFVLDEVISNDGTLIRSYRFRTTGSGTEYFRTIGRWLRKCSIDEYPALWNVMLGEVRLRDVTKYIYRPKRFSN